MRTSVNCIIILNAELNYRKLTHTYNITALCIMKLNKLSGEYPNYVEPNRNSKVYFAQNVNVPMRGKWPARMLH